MEETRTITLQEYDEHYLEADQLSYADGEHIYREHGGKIGIDFPSPKTGGRWRLKSLGWVGFLPVRSGLRIAMKPKMPVGNLFRMLEYAYRLRSFEIFDGVIESDKVEDIYLRLADILARRVLDRSRRGLYRAYLPEEDRLPYIRGSLDVARSIRAPWELALHCSYQEHTADLHENQLLAWTLHTIMRQGAGLRSGNLRRTQEVLGRVRAAYRALHGLVSLHPFRPADCIGRLYNRLNDDYRPLHALCRFFLEQTGPGHGQGDQEMLPFLVNMAGLYELYVAEYLKECLERYEAGALRLTPQQKFDLSADGRISITIDLLLTDAGTGETMAVLDTKYKNPDTPSPDDLQQIVAYAVARNSRRAILIYPNALKVPFNGIYGNGWVEVLTATVSSEGIISPELLRVLGLERIKGESDR